MPVSGGEAIECHMCQRYTLDVLKACLVGEGYDGIVTQPVFERRAMLLGTVGPLQHSDAPARNATRLRESTHRIGYFVQHVTEKYQIERAISEGQRISGRFHKAGIWNVPLSEFEHFRTHINAGDSHPPPVKRLGKNAAACADIQNAACGVPIKARFHDALDFQERHAFGGAQSVRRPWVAMAVMAVMVVITHTHMPPYGENLLALTCRRKRASIWIKEVSVRIQHTPVQGK